MSLEKEQEKATPFVRKILEEPHYGWARNGEAYLASHKEILTEFVSRLNIFRSRKNWITFLSWGLSFFLAVPLFIFLTQYFSIGLFLLGAVYGMVLMGSHGTLYLHRYGTHRAFVFKNRFWLFIVKNLVIKILPEEIYMVSHHVHHRFSDQMGDPYYSRAGFLYCFLADANHHPINRNLSKPEYAIVARMLNHTGVHVNSYEQYQKWGSLCHPARTVFHYVANWAFWAGVFYLIGGPALTFAIFGWAGVWAFGVRTFNYDGHGRGKNTQKEGSDFYDKDLSVNQMWPGYVAGEWHNNHHLYPNAMRSGFLSYQLDLPWLFIKFLSRIGAVCKTVDAKPDFLKKYYEPYLASKLNSSKPLATSRNS